MKGINEFPSPAYIEELKPKIGPQAASQVAQMTFLNPAADRGQILLEFYESTIG
jgi:hypothetical protein